MCMQQSKEREISPQENTLSSCATDLKVPLFPNIVDSALEFNEQRERREETVALSLMVAERIISSLDVGSNGFTKLIIPAEVSDVEAMQALNMYAFMKLKDLDVGPIFISANIGAIQDSDLAWYKHHESIFREDVSRERLIEVVVIAERTLHKSRYEQEKALSAQRLTFAKPRDVALVVGAYKCANHGGNLVGLTKIRTAALQTMLNNNYPTGVFRERDFGFDNFSIAAAGVRCGTN